MLGEHLGTVALANDPMLEALAAGPDPSVRTRPVDADDVYLPERIQALGQLAAARPDLDILTTDAFLEVGRHRLRRCYGDAFPFVVDDQRSGILERNFIFGLAAVRGR